MKLDLSSLRNKTEHSISFEKNINLDKLEVGGRSINFLSPIKVDGSAYRTDSDVHISADVTFEYSEKCDRCLETLTKSMVTVLSGRLIDKSNKIKSQDEEELLIYYDGDSVEIEDAIISTILLSIPMKSLCSEDCKGLCSTCGINLNHDECECKHENIDPRLAKLKKLLD